MLIQETNSHDLRIAMLPYTSALKLVDMYIDTIEEELFTYKSQNPIEHVKSRLKRPSSIARKLEKRGYEPTLENALKYIDDIAGVRIVCQFQDDIYKVAEVIKNFKNIRIVQIKDYIKEPMLHDFDYGNPSPYSDQYGTFISYNPKTKQFEKYPRGWIKLENDMYEQGNPLTKTLSNKIEEILSAYSDKKQKIR